MHNEVLHNSSCKLFSTSKDKSNIYPTMNKMRMSEREIEIKDEFI